MEDNKIKGADKEEWDKMRPFVHLAIAALMSMHGNGPEYGFMTSEMLIKVWEKEYLG